MCLSVSISVYACVCIGICVHRQVCMYVLVCMGMCVKGRERVCREIAKAVFALN